MHFKASKAILNSLFKALPCFFSPCVSLKYPDTAAKLLQITDLLTDFMHLSFPKWMSQICRQKASQSQDQELTLLFSDLMKRPSRLISTRTLHNSFGDQRERRCACIHTHPYASRLTTRCGNTDHFFYRIPAKTKQLAEDTHWYTFTQILTSNYCASHQALQLVD